jgi:hypothetical protein
MTVNLTKLMQILTVNGINLCVRRLITDQAVELKLEQGEGRRVETGREVRRG